MEGQDTSSTRRGAYSNVPADKQDFWDSFGDEPKGPVKDKQDFWDEFGAPPKGPSKDKQDFWDEFGGAASERGGLMSGGLGGAGASKKPSGIGTSAMKKSGGGGKKDEDWGEW